MKNSILFGAISILLAGSATAQGGDDCSVATAIGTTGTFAFDSTAATTSAFNGGGSCAAGANTINQDLFWQWTCPANGDYQFDTDTSTFDTKIAVHAGVGCAATCVAYDDDGGAGLQSLTTLSGLTAGDMFLIQVGGFGGNSGLGNLNISTFVDPCSIPDALEDNDTIATAAAIASSGTISGLTVGSSDPDFYEVTVNPGEIVTVDHSVSPGSLDFNVFDTNGNYYRNETFDFRWSNTTAATTTFIFEVVNTSTSAPCATYDLILSVATDAGCATDDAFEDNDDCSTPSPITLGSHPNLMVGLGDRDFYSYVLAPGKTLDVDLSGFSVDVDFEFRNNGCAAGVSGTAFDDFEITNPGPGNMTVIFEALIDPSLTQATCTAYQLDVAEIDDPCFGAVDDAFEENDDCATATPIADGTYTNLFIQEPDKDCFAFCVAAGATVNCDILFIDAVADLDFFLRDAAAVECGTGNGTNELADGFSVTDNETLSWTNNTGADLDVVLEVDVFTVGGCNNYDLIISGSGCGGVGTTFCDPAIANSTGASTTLAGTNGTGVESGLRLDASNGVPSEFGYFLVSAGMADPGIMLSNGEFCLFDGTNPFGRYNFGSTTNSIGAFDAAGNFQNLVGTGTSNGGYGYDVATTLPFTGSPMIMAGETWNFQLWHRDTPAGVGTANFSNGLSVTF